MCRWNIADLRFRQRAANWRNETPCVSDLWAARWEASIGRVSRRFTKTRLALNTKKKDLYKVILQYGCIVGIYMIYLECLCDPMISYVCVHLEFQQGAFLKHRYTSYHCTCLLWLELRLVQSRWVQKGSTGQQTVGEAGSSSVALGEQNNVDRWRVSWSHFRNNVINQNDAFAQFLNW